MTSLTSSGNFGRIFGDCAGALYHGGLLHGLLVVYQKGYALLEFKISCLYL